MMKRVQLLLFSALLMGSPLMVPAVVFTWTGIGNGWKNQVAPPNDGTANLVFDDNVSTTIPIPSPVFSINSASFVSDNRFLFVPQSGNTILSIGAGGMSANNSFGGSTVIDFDAGITLTLGASQVWDFGNGGGHAIIHGVLNGSGNLTLTGSNNNNSPSLILANQTPNANVGYTGSITLGNSTTANFNPTLVLWASGNLGAGSTAGSTTNSLTFVNGGQLVTHNTTSVPNNLFLNTGPLPSGNNNGQFTPVSFKAWDAPLTLGGSVTLANSTTINAQLANPDIQAQFAGDTGSWPLAGPRTRHPIVFTGAIGEGSAGKSLNVIGPGVVILAGPNTYTGGTNVGFATGTTFNQQGALIFAQVNAIPTSGALQSGLLNTAGASGYIGIAAAAVPAAGNFNTFLGAFNPASSGAVGIDSLTGNVPSATPATYAQNIDLSTFNGTGTTGIRFGTATSLIFTGTIKPQLNTNYHFGNGGGRLFLQTALANQPSATTGLRAESQGAFPLQLFLQGSNTYTGGTVASNGIVVFDSANSLPASGTLRADGGSTNNGSSYIGYTDSTGLTPAAFLAKFDQANTWGILGFDTHFDPNTNVANTTVNIANLDLTGFNNGVFIGTNSSAILSGALKPTSVTNADHGANTLRLTAASGGTLTVTSLLADIISPVPAALSVTLGSPAGSPAFSDGTIVLGSANTYTGGTTVNNNGNLSLVAGHSSAFGAGSITLRPHGGVLALSAGVAGVNLANAIVFGQAAPNTGYTPILNLTGSNDFTLSGSISGPDRTAIHTQNDVGQGLIALNNTSPVNVTVAGNNSGFHGTFLAQNGTLTFAADNAAGHAQIQMNGPTASVAFTSANPVIYGLTTVGGAAGTVTLGGTTNLTVDTTDNNLDYDLDFGGALVGASTSKLTVNAAINPNADTEFFYLYGSSPSFSGNVFITGQAALALGKNDSAGTGTITLNATDGGLALNTGVSLTNPLVFNTGALAGLGTFAPSSVTGTGQTAGRITFGTNQMVFPGIPGDDSIPGKLTLSTNVAFATGGEFALLVQDPAATEGYGILNITGSLDLNSISTAGFTFDLESLDAGGKTNPASTIVWGNSYQLQIVTATGGITGFNAASFAFDVSKFQGGQIPATYFNVTADATHLYLNFTAIPEPSTWALLLAGSTLLGLTARRRRRR